MADVHASGAATGLKGAAGQAPAAGTERGDGETTASLINNPADLVDNSEVPEYFQGEKVPSLQDIEAEHEFHAKIAKARIRRMAILHAAGKLQPAAEARRPAPGQTPPPAGTGARLHLLRPAAPAEPPGTDPVAAPEEPKRRRGGAALGSLALVAGIAAIGWIWVQSNQPPAPGDRPLASQNSGGLPGQAGRPQFPPALAAIAPPSPGLPMPTPAGAGLPFRSDADLSIIRANPITMRRPNPGTAPAGTNALPPSPAERRPGNPGATAIAEIATDPAEAATSAPQPTLSETGPLVASQLEASADLSPPDGRTMPALAAALAGPDLPGSAAARARPAGGTLAAPAPPADTARPRFAGGAAAGPGTVGSLAPDPSQGPSRLGETGIGPGFAAVLPPNRPAAGFNRQGPGGLLAMLAEPADELARALPGTTARPRPQLLPTITIGAYNAVPGGDSAPRIAAPAPAATASAGRPEAWPGRNGIAPPNLPDLVPQRLPAVTPVPLVLAAGGSLRGVADIGASLPPSGAWSADGPPAQVLPARIEPALRLPQSSPDRDPPAPPAVATGPSDAARINALLFAPALVSGAAVADSHAQLLATGYTVAEPKRVGFRISYDQVRYFSPGDEDAARSLAGAIGARVRDFTDFRPAPAEGTVEIWLSGQGTATAPRPRNSGQTAAINSVRSRILDRIRSGGGN